MSNELLNLALRFADGDVPALKFADDFIDRWKKERDDGRLRQDAPDVSESLSSIFCLADLFNPESNRETYEFDEEKLRNEIKRILRRITMTEDGLPTQDDFDPWHGNPDASWAHGIFGGLSIPEAIQKYQERPDLYWEAFMCMGGKAFAFYFPVIEHFVYSVPDLNYDDEDWNDPHGWILAKSIKAQFGPQNYHYVQHLAARVIELARFVQDHIHRFEDLNLRDESVSDAWAELVRTVQSRRESP